MISKNIVITVSVVVGTLIVLSLFVYPLVSQPQSASNLSQEISSNTSILDISSVSSNIEETIEPKIGDATKMSQNPNSETVPVQVPTKIVDTKSDKILISQAELAAANNSSLCYVSYKGEVYDITTYLPRHPGGINKPLKQCGKVIDNLSEIHPGGQFDSPKIQSILREKLIGNLEN